MSKGILPRNLTARAAYQVVGNPVDTRFETGVANCYPGLEFDIRTFETRFFPGLVFRFVTTKYIRVTPPVPPVQGAHMIFVDQYDDPMLSWTSEEPWVQKLIADVSAASSALGNGQWYLDWLEQGGKRISMSDPSGTPLDGQDVWWFVRVLEPEIPLTISLVRRNPPPGPNDSPVILHGYRRRYVNAAGVIDLAYKPGEFTQAMCVPWQHDFRDCACHYWAANHPDVVQADPKKELMDGESVSPIRANTDLDWLRNDLKVAGDSSVQNNVFANRPYQIDHFWINQNWEQLRFVLEGKELESEYKPVLPSAADGYTSPTELIDALEQELGPLEMMLALEYLYALFSIKSPDEVPPDRWPTLKDDVTFVRRYLMLVAVGEMTHLRWVNQLLWELDKAGLFPPGRTYRPILSSSPRYNPKLPPRSGELRSLNAETLNDFIAAERPMDLLDYSYARCVATLSDHKIYPAHLYEIAVRIDTDGNNHFDRFNDIKRALEVYQSAKPPYPYLRELKIGTPAETKQALHHFNELVRLLGRAYQAEAAGHFSEAQRHINAARLKMIDLQTEAEKLAASGVGVPFFTTEEGKSVTG